MIHTSTATPHLATTNEAWGGEGAFNSATLCTGRGFIVDGTLVATRMHIVALRGGSRTDLPVRFLAAQFRVARVCRRSYAADGVTELQPAQTRTVVTPRGYLTKDTTVQHSADEFVGAEAVASCLAPVCGRAGFSVASQRSALHPAKACVFELWLDAGKFVSGDFVPGQQYRCKTRGDSPIVESACRIDRDGLEKPLTYFAGEDQLGSSWTDRIAAAKKSTAPAPAAASTASAPGDSAADDEWD